ncbi:hypothetical protein BLNAU_5038 [Blattamonas nauphoetae]|uniref:Uncharacterized protein n=1 Tax=Blattamonas nauphoetae TaxID=2049346 RepID=A0ABQ9Y8X0_9EUKA|nr:hypothetical protein BLNAU_5038 [Blattamonas nauphoetae]
MEDNILIQSHVDTAIPYHAPDSNRTVVPEDEPFLNFDHCYDLSFEDKSRIYNSLVTLVKAEYPFDDALQDRVVMFLKSLRPQWGESRQAARLVTDLVSSSAGSDSGFLESILTLLSSPDSTIVAAALSFINETARISSPPIRCRLVNSDLIAKVLTTVQPHTLPVSGNEEIFDNLNKLILSSLNLAYPSSLLDLGLTTVVNQSNHREMIFQKVVLPSPQFLTFLISNRHVLKGDLSLSFMYLLSTLLQISTFHCPTLEFVLASPIMMAFSSCFSFFEDDSFLWTILNYINRSLEEWKKEGLEVIQSVKRMMQALISEGFEDALEQMMKHDYEDYYCNEIVEFIHCISQSLGSNAKKTRW